MGLVTVLKSKKIFSEFTTAQLQAMIHDVAIQEMRGGNKVRLAQFYKIIPSLISFSVYP